MFFPKSTTLLPATDNNVRSAFHSGRQEFPSAIRQDPRLSSMTLPRRLRIDLGSLNSTVYSFARALMCQNHRILETGPYQNLCDRYRVSYCIFLNLGNWTQSPSYSKVCVRNERTVSGTFPAGFGGQSRCFWWAIAILRYLDRHYQKSQTLIFAVDDICANGYILDTLHKFVHLVVAQFSLISILVMVA